ncbi:MFS transporter [Mucilaginibacter sp. UR6-1]|uniref:MFS transporter n=1 Tax=Mucilaginibacter sp. UR6-1 TaxID=1435643 RepID=UPI001E3C6776|nr:MFS transporter [Mucilaginibacter sp. UR6-1]MCC8407385.1 MFS transporter [Mucilaginibacter sp. UR6-1]
MNETAIIAPAPQKSVSRLAHRVAVSSLFFTQGLCFASWASRIPTFQQKFQLNEAEIGGLLLALPAGLMVALPFSGWFTAKFGSRVVVLAATVIYALTLIVIGLSPSVYALLAGLFVFGFSGNMVNIAVNTQAVQVEALYSKPIMASFHGLWSLAGFTGASIGTIMIGFELIPFWHYVIITAAVLIITAIASGFVIKDTGSVSADQPVFAKPDKALMLLGVIAFSGLMCEGAMVDWGGIYFKEIVHAQKAWIGAGYTAYMCTMAGGRFVADFFTARFGMKKMLQMSGALIAAGLLLSVIFPQLYTAIAGFFIVGFGVSSIIPLVYGEAGKSTTMSAGVALAAVSTVGFLGFLLGPPIIGFAAAATNLRVSYTIIAVMGLTVTMLSSKLKQ